ncbi:MAG: hypothetical protein AB8F94_03545 [Saprospiraceae bacterium]
MKKQIILILFLLGNLTSSFSNNNILGSSKTAFDELVGTYQGFVLSEQGTDNANNIIAELTSDFNLKITEDFDGLLVEHINEKLSPKVAGLLETGDYSFEFKAASEKSEFKVIRISIHTKPLIPNTNFSMSIAMLKESTELSVFAVKKKGGNPKTPSKNIDFSELHNSVFYTGKTQDNTFGDYKIEWYPSQGIGYLNYKNVTNVFKIERKENKYRLTNKYGIDLEYYYNYLGEKKMKLLDIHSGRNLLYQGVKYGRRLSPKAVGTEKDFLIEVGASFHDVIHDRFKPKGNYTLNHDNKLNGKGIEILSENKMFVVYAGEMKDGIFHGKGSAIQDGESSNGIFQNGIQHGHFEVTLSNGSIASGEFVNGKQEGLWKVKHTNGAKFDMDFKDGKKINSTHTNSHLRVENKRVLQLVKQGRKVGQIQYKCADLVETITRCVNLDREENTLGDYKYCLAGMKDKLDEITASLSTAIKHTGKTIKEAEKDGCFETVETIKTVKHELEVAKDRFASARYYFKDLMAADNNKDVRKEALKIADYMVDGEDFFVKSQNRLLSIKTCYEYTNTGSSTPPARSAAPKKSTRKTQPSTSTNKKTTPQPSTAVVAKPIVYPSFTGKYEGDNLLLLMGRKIDDPAVQGLLNNSYFDFEESFNGVSKVQKKFTCNKYRFSIKFENGILTQMNFKYLSFDKSGYFKKRMPLGIPMAKPLSKMKNMKDIWTLSKYSSIRDYSLSKYQLSFEVTGDINDGGVIQIVNIKAEDVKDWNSYYRQFK